MRTALAAAVLLALSAAPLTASAQAAGITEFEPSGEVLFRVSGATGSSAAFDAERVIGPSVNLERRDDGLWAGDLVVDQSVEMEVSDSRASGVNVDLHLGHDEGKLTIRGNVFATRVWLEVKEKSISGRTGECSIDLKRKAPGVYQGNVGCARAGTRFPQTGRAELKLVGDAGSPQPPMPQLAFALVSVLPQ